MRHAALALAGLLAAGPSLASPRSGRTTAPRLAARPAAPKPPPRPAPKPTTGTVVGQLRHKGCQSFASGAQVGVVGKDVSATADATGRFSLALPPGTYSLVIGGPNLVGDQRVDGVSVTLGATDDLGVVEVWPEERPPNCGSAQDTGGAEEPTVAFAPDTPTLDLPGTQVAPAAPSADQVWVRGSPGPALGQFGLQGNPARDDEDALGPPAFAVGPQGMLFVLDVLNNRVQRFDVKGHPAASFPLTRAADGIVESDITVADDGAIFVYNGGDAPALAEYDAQGRPEVWGALPPSFHGVDFLFAPHAGHGKPVLLMQNGQSVRADLSWTGLKPEGPLPGLPFGDQFVRVEKVSRNRAAVKLVTAEGLVRRSVQLRSKVQITGIRLVGVDRKGAVVVAVDRAEPGDGTVPRAEVLLLAVTQMGQLVGSAVLPPGDRRFEFRELALAPDGSVVQMQSDAAEVRFVRWTLAPPPKDAVAGDGLVRGRVLEGGKPSASAVVSVARLKRQVPVMPDGTFEVRLPAGTYTVGFHRAGPPPASDAVAERKVAVAAGATVDLGNVVIAAARDPHPDAGAPPPKER